jgi:DNA repair protein RadC
MAPRLAGLRHEEMWVIGLDGHNHPRTPRRVSQGGRSSTPLCAADVLRPAIGDAATGMILVHNHPSGDPSPSNADLALSRNLAEGGRAVGIVLVDHVIVCPSGEHVSLFDCGFVTPR